MTFDTVGHRARSLNAPMMRGAALAVVVAVSVAACLVGFACRQIDVGVGGVAVALLATGASLSCLTTESRRIRDAQRPRRVS